MSNFIISCQGDTQNLCMQELFSIKTDIKLNRWLDNGVGIIESELEFVEMSELISRSKLIFLRHIFPLDYTIPINSFEIDNQTLNEFSSNFYIEIKKRLDKNLSFSIQVRTSQFESNELNKHDIGHFFADKLIEDGFIFDVKNPQQVISIFAARNNLYIGISFAKYNLSNWAGGMHRYAKTEEQISRAELKLLEAIDTFNLSIPKDGYGLDLGAAPGGWTKVLLEYCKHVVAVDPAELSPVFNNNKNITHYKGLAQDYLQTTDKTFHVIVNDMRMDVVDSAKIMVEMKESLAKNGIMIMTFKLPKKKQTTVIQKGIKVLELDFEILYKKQLFHNRSEITVVMRRKNEK